MSYMSFYGPQNMEARYQTIYISLVPKASELLTAQAHRLNQPLSHWLWYTYFFAVDNNHQRTYAESFGNGVVDDKKVCRT